MEAFRDITGIFTILVIAGIVTTLVLPNRKTPEVISATFGGFASALSVAMGGSAGSFGASANGIQ